MNQAFKVALVIVVFFGIFAAGSVTGLVVTAHYANRRVAQERQEREDERRQSDQQMEQFRQQQAQEQEKLVQQVAQLRQQVQRQSQQVRMPPAPAQFGPQLMQRFMKQIDATPEQAEQIRPLVFQAAEDLRRLRLDTTHSTELILQKLQDQVSALLTPGQRVRFDALIERSREAFRKYNLNQQLRQERQRQFERRQQWQYRQQNQPQLDGQPTQPSQPPAQTPAPAAAQP